MRLLSFTNFRVIVLLSILIVASVISLHQKIQTRSWTQPLEVVVLPINGDETLETDNYITSLSDNDVVEIEHWFKREALKHNLQLDEPVNIRMGQQVFSTPPTFPRKAHALNVVVWGLRFRWWAFRNTPGHDSGLTLVRMFVVYHQGEDNIPLQHSLGMEKGLLGLVHAFALPTQTAQNNIVIAHEMLHTVGAIDKYEFSGAPIFPVGYANPLREPLFPQRNAEIMAGKIPLSHTRSYMAESLKSVVINHYTAAEINWLD